MRKVKTVVARKIDVQFNTVKNSPNHQWGIIKDLNTKEVLHRGQPKYIERVAKVRYNHTIVS